jgi:hypothetical protein
MAASEARSQLGFSANVYHRAFPQTTRKEVSRAQDAEFPAEILQALFTHKSKVRLAAAHLLTMSPARNFLRVRDKRAREVSEPYQR